MIKNFILEVTKSYTICSFDVESRYTNVSGREAIKIALDMIFQSMKRVNTPLSRDQIKTLLEGTIYNVPFRFQNEIYIQKDGIAMGPPLTTHSGKLIHGTNGRKSESYIVIQTNFVAKIRRRYLLYIHHLT